MSRRETALVCATAVVAMLVLWWAAGLPGGWVAWAVRIAAVAAIPAVFFGVIAAQMMRQVWREEAGMTKEQIRARRRAAWTGVEHDTAPLLSRPNLYFRPLTRGWELWKSAATDDDKKKRT